jgi:acetyl esterase/lipase
VPYATYPAQLRESVEALNYVVHDLERPASTVSLGGDSAGGNLCLAVLSHMLHPNKNLPELKLREPLKSLLLIAPWTSYDVKTFKSAQSNRFRDVIDPSIAEVWSGDYLAGVPSNPYAEACLADAEWWRGAEKKVEQVICVAGSHELLIDAVTDWVKKYRSVTPAGHIEFVVGHEEIHTAPIIEPVLGDSTPTKQGEALKAFAKSRL